MLIAKANYTGVVANFFREKVATIDTVASHYKIAGDLLSGVTTSRVPNIKSNDAISIENTASRASHNKLAFDLFYEGSPLPQLFKEKTGYYLQDFSQNAYTLASYFGQINLSSRLDVTSPFSVDLSAEKLKMVGNLIGTVTSSSLPLISGGFTSCIITNQGKPYLYLDNSGERYYIGSEIEATDDQCPWRTRIGEICCNFIHCNSMLSQEELSCVKSTFLSLGDANKLYSSNIIESTGAADIPATKIQEVNNILQRK